MNSQYCLTTVFASPPAVPVFVPASGASSPQSVCCEQPAAFAAVPATLALVLAVAVVAGQRLDRQKDRINIIYGISHETTKIKGIFGKLPNYILISIPRWHNSILLFRSLTFSTSRNVPSQSCYFLLDFILLSIQSPDLGVDVVPLLYQSGSLSTIFFVFGLKQHIKVRHTAQIVAVTNT